MKNADLLILFLANFFAALVMVCARIGYVMFALNVTPPDDPIQAIHWHRKRRWLLISEFMALPAFALIAVVSKVYWNLPEITSTLIAMVCGALGFGFLLDGLQFIVKKRMGMNA